MNKNEKFLIGTVGALLAGIAIGVLVAPKEGKHTRKLIKNKANDLGGITKDKYSKSIDELSALAEKLKEGFVKNLESAKGKATSVAENVGDKVKGVVNNNA
tara:strand:- start:314 stop:616 length:303 start_codon:yes stop_codon:yes gene_type:complete